MEEGLQSPRVQVVTYLLSNTTEEKKTVSSRNNMECAFQPCQPDWGCPDRLSQHLPKPLGSLFPKMVEV